jgi:hypothetical protein
MTGMETALIAHPGHATLGADVGRYPLQGHHRDGAGVLGDLRLLRRDHVHDHAALEHLGHAALDASGAGDGFGGLCGNLGHDSDASPGASGCRRPIAP